ncbi:uncharacterized protein LOC141825286 [Curcuma longa]|uniref:uncharacterized protein LOC141825286 n=1 Tax=Curcuma longa TaxID=136217 RepID=UPI003D9E63F7
MEESAHHEQRDQGEQEEEGGGETLVPSFPTGRVKKIVKLDKEIRKLNSEALFLISLSAELFLDSLVLGARSAALQKKRRTIKPDHIREAVRAHRPTADFLLDCLPKPTPPPPKPASGAKNRSAEGKPLPSGTRRIDDFFRKPS